MFNVDTNTLYLVLILVGLATSLLLTIVGRGVDQSLLIWALGFACHASGFILLILRGVIPDLLSIWLANVVICCSYALFAVGLLKFINRRLSPVLVWAPPALVAAVYLFMMDNLTGRILVGGVAHLMQLTLLLAIMRIYSPQMIGRGKHILTVCFALGLLIAVARPLAIVFGITQIETFDSPGVLQAMTFLSMTIVNMAIALSFVLMQKEHAEAATDSIARSDELTGLPNRRRLYERIAQFMAAKTSARQYGALMLMDLDNFKTLNDTYGHAAGDLLLKQVAQRLKELMRPCDTVARLGGDEFVVLMADLGTDWVLAQERAADCARKIRQRLSEPYTLMLPDAGEDPSACIVHHTSATLGIKVFSSDAQDIGREALLRDADKAMYTAKNMQRGSMQMAG